MKKVIGISKFTSKKGTLCACIHCTDDFSQIEVNNGASGLKVIPIMCYGDNAAMVSDKFIGKELVGFFGYSNGSVVVQNPSVK